MERARFVDSSFQNEAVEVVEFAEGKLPGSSCCAGTARIPSHQVAERLI
jgi:hypothetical protein